MPYPELFDWWVTTISWSTIFLVCVSAYLYVRSGTKLRTGGNGKTKLLRDFVFVWVLLSLLLLYIISINRGSAILFAIGNIVVEAMLIIYLLKNKSKTRPGCAEQETGVGTCVT